MGKNNLSRNVWYKIQALQKELSSYFRTEVEFCEGIGTFDHRMKTFVEPVSVLKDMDGNLYPATIQKKLTEGRELYVEFHRLMDLDDGDSEGNHTYALDESLKVSRDKKVAFLLGIGCTTKTAAKKVGMSDNTLRKKFKKGELFHEVELQIFTQQEFAKRIQPEPIQLSIFDEIY